MEDLSLVILLRKTNANRVSFVHPLNLIWVSGCNTQPGWNVLMSASTRKLKAHDISYIIAIPFSSLYTVLCFST